MRLSRLGALALVLALAASFVAACGGKGNAPVRERPRVVTTEPVAADEAVEAVVLLGDVRGASEVRVFAQLPERVRELHVAVGARVAAGDPIVTLEATMQSANVAQASGAVEAAIANRDRLRADLERSERLAGTGAVAAAQIDTLRSGLAAAEAQVRQLGGALGAARTQSSRAVIRAAVEGTIGQLNVERGDMANPAIPIATIVDAERLEVVVRAPERDVVRIQLGMPVSITPPALPNVTVRGTVAEIPPVIDRLTRSGEIVITVEDPERRLRPGMVARASIELARRPGVLLVPGRAILLTPETDETGRAIAFVVEGTAAKRREVVVGARYDERIEVREGLRAGERLVVRGQHLLRDGSPVRTSAGGEGDRGAGAPAS